MLNIVSSTMGGCSIISCKSRTEQANNDVTFHSFPKDIDIKNVWINATGRRQNWQPNRSSKICSIHFDDGAISIINKIRRIKPEAIPVKHVHESNKCNSPKNNYLKNNTGSPQSSPKTGENNSEINTAFRNRSVRLRNRKAYLLNRRCSVPHCNTRPTNEISLHPCPNNAAVRNEWADALRVSYQYVKNMVACSLHFTKIDFITSKNSERVLKYNAVPSRNLPNRKKAELPVKHKLLKKDVSAKAVVKQQTMIDTVVETKEATQEEVVRECRACLKKLDDKKSCCNVFQAWAPPWDGMEASIAEDLAKLANVEISPTDRHSKVLCVPCYQRLLEAATFASKVRSCDLLLRMRFTAEIDIEKVWPKPIQVDKNINGSVFNTSMDIEIKQEVVSEEEYPVNGTDNPYVETELANLDIKIEPEELVEPPPMNITINGTISLNPLNSENKDAKNGSELNQESHFLEMDVKQEPTSEGEQDLEQTPDLSLECLLCTKSFNSVTGLKAHVIAQHSYKTVKRKADGSVSPEKKRCDQHQCKICKRNFQTSTDLMVHETCHNKHACYGCTEKFDSFELLTRHRKRCKASIGNSVQKLKTLEDVKRPLPEEQVEYLSLEIEKIESEVTFQDEDIEMKEAQPLKDEDVEMKDISSVQKEEISKDSPVASEDDKNKLDCVNEEVESDKIPESVNEEVEIDKNPESVNEEVESDKNPESVKGVVESDKNPESVNEEVESDKNPESVNEEVESDKNSESVNEEVENDKNPESVKEVVESDKNPESVKVEVENNVKSESRMGESESNNKSESVIEDVDTETLLESIKGIVEVENDKELGNVVLAVDNTVQSSIREVDSDSKKAIKEDLGSDEINTESEEKVIKSEDNITESLNKEIEEDSDSNMKLHLEIHSTENETEPALCNADMPLESLENDDCT